MTSSTTISINCFTEIPSPVVFHLGRAFSGGVKSALSFDVTLTEGKDGSATLGPISRSFAETLEYVADPFGTLPRPDHFHVEGKPDWFHDLRSGANPVDRGTAVATNKTLHAELVEGSDVPEGFAAAVKLFVVGDNPLVSGAPTIDGEFTIGLLLKCDILKYTISGEHDGFPNHTVTLEAGGIQVSLVKHDAVARNQGPGSLFPPAEWSVETSGDFRLPQSTSSIHDLKGSGTIEDSAEGYVLDASSSPGDNTIRGGSGDDMIRGGSGDDMIRGGSGDDMIRGGSGDDTIRSGGDDDTIASGTGDDTIVSGAGDDTIHGGGGGDTIVAGAGDDGIRGDDGSNTANDGGSDLLRGEKGDDTIKGGASGDTLDGGTGDDRMEGGSGADQFWFNIVTGDHDTIADLNFSEGDTLILNGTKIASNADILALTAANGVVIMDIGTNEVVNFGSGNILTLQNYDL